MAVNDLLTADDLGALPVESADFRLYYGSAAVQFGDLYLPQSAGPHPVVLLIHGGCWRARYGLDHISSLSRALTALDVAVWSVEYRRLGDAGGGWPGTLTDVAYSADFLRHLAPLHDLDLDRVCAVGHSAGGHLALWLAARPQLPVASPLAVGDPLPIHHVISLAGIPDLAQAVAQGVCGSAPVELLGGRPDDLPERYVHASPQALLPLGVPLRLINGAHDDIVPTAYVADFVAAARAAGDDVALRVLPNSAHFELIVPHSSAWPTVCDAIAAWLAQ